MNPIKTVSFATLTALLTSGYAAASTILIASSFDGGSTTGPAFQEFNNGQGTNGNSNPATGVISTATDSSNNSNVGMNNSSTVDVTSFSSFTIDYVVSSSTFSSTNPASDITFNGWFFGIGPSTATTGSGIYANNPGSIGVVMFTDTGGGRPASMSFVQDGGGAVAQTSLAVAEPSLASLQDGFTISITLNDDDSWSAISNGLSADFSQSGTLTNANNNFLYADLTSVSTNTSVQGGSLSYTLDSVTLTAVPEPSSSALLGVSMSLILLRRRR